MPPIWVINLDRSPERMKQSEEEFAQQSLEVTRWPATDGKALTEEQLREKATWWARYFCTPGMVGCFLSHLGCWKKVAAQDHPCVIVVEDDVVPYDSFKERIQGLLKELEALEDGWDVCLLGAIGCINPEREKLFMRFYEFGPGGGRPAPKGANTRRLSEHVFVPHRPAGTHAYMISKQGAEKLSKLLPKASYHVDLAAWGLRDLNLVAADPFLATQRFDEEGVVSTVASSASKSERFLRWVWKATGIVEMGKIGGVTDVSWAWRTALFAVPIPPWRPWPQRAKAISQGPFVSVFMMLSVLGLARRSGFWGGIASAYVCVMSGFIRFLCGTFSWPIFLSEAAVAAGLFYAVPLRI